MLLRQPADATQSSPRTHPLNSPISGSTQFDASSATSPPIPVPPLTSTPTPFGNQIPTTCTNTYSYEEMGQHVNSGACGNLDIACCYRRCGASGFKSVLELRKHLETKCLYTRTKCTLCGTESRRRDMNPTTGYHDYFHCISCLEDSIRSEEEKHL